MNNFRIFVEQNNSASAEDFVALPTLEDFPTLPQTPEEWIKLVGPVDDDDIYPKTL